MTTATSLRRMLGRRPGPPQQLAVLEGYARWAATYEQDMDGHPLALAESGAMCALLPPSCQDIVALDAACGTGRLYAPAGRTRRAAGDRRRSINSNAGARA